ncbi:MAG: ribonuclease P protein component [Syntrophobacterales bacterium]|nr:MAG: ribonuclease P protein component [Syntrophobacterales bacterium]
MMGRSFRRENRIAGKVDFWKDRRRRKKFDTEHFILFLRKNDRDTRRLGLVVGKKVGGAVSRNRIKRLIREFFRINQGRIPESSDLIVLAKEKIEIQGYREVFEELKVILDQPGNYLRGH